MEEEQKNEILAEANHKIYKPDAWGYNDAKEHYNSIVKILQFYRFTEY